MPAQIDTLSPHGQEATSSRTRKRQNAEVGATAYAFAIWTALHLPGSLAQACGYARAFFSSGCAAVTHCGAVCRSQQDKLALLRLLVRPAQSP